jgi:lipooligosaccharide transport system permease protein
MVLTAFAPGRYRTVDDSLRRSASVLGRNISALQSLYWLMIVSGFIEPLLYLLSIGIGVGALIGPVHLPDGTTVGYATFVAPAMLASSAMTGALMETTFNFFAKMKFSKLYDAVLATPVRPMEIALGELMWAMARGAIYSVAFLAVMVWFGYTTVVPALLAFLASMLVGFAFGSLGMAVSTWIRGWQDFDLVGSAEIALFLFSATFTPLTAYHSAVVRFVISCSPLYQSVELIRGITLDRLSWGLMWHVLYLAVLTVVGLLIAARRMGSQLLR